MKRVFLTSLILIALLASQTPRAMASEILLIVDFPSISPNGDAIKDAFTASMILANPVDTVMITIEDTGLTTVFDTIFLMEGLMAGEYSAFWDGTDRVGTLLPEGDYLLRLFESNGAAGEFQQRTVVVDLTAPSIAVDRIEPGVFSPGFPTDTSTVDIYYIVSGYETGSEGQIYFTSPANAHFSFPVTVSGNGENLFRWAPLAEYPSGIYTFDISITDDAGNSSMDSGAIELDTDDPEVVILTEVGFRTPQPPLTMTGYCRDASGIKTGSLKLRWGQNDSAGVPYDTNPFDADLTWLQGDTLYWSFDLPDTVTGVVSWVENTYMLKVSCYDNYDMFKQVTKSFTLDRTPPGAPVILNPGGIVIRPTLELDLEYDSDVDSLFISRRFEEEITKVGILEMMVPEVVLEPGLNEIWVAAKDEAGNLGPDSEILEITLSTEAGFEFPEAFREPGTFQVVTPQPVRGIVIYIYDMGGEHVRRLEEWSGSTVYTIAWDLLNDDGETVRNGPYLMVMTIYALDGSKTVRKEFIAVVK